MDSNELLKTIGNDLIHVEQMTIKNITDMARLKSIKLCG